MPDAPPAGDRYQRALTRILEAASREPWRKEIRNRALQGSDLPLADAAGKRKAVEDVKVLAAAGRAPAIHDIAEEALREA